MYIKVTKEEGREKMFAKKKSKNTRKRLDNYWKENYDIDLEYEKLIYFFVCNRIKKKDAKKLRNEHKFYTYSAWKSHVETKCKKITNLGELYRYLNIKRRIYSNLNNGYIIFFIPFVYPLFEGITKKYLQSYLSEMPLLKEGLQSNNPLIFLITYSIAIMPLLMIGFLILYLLNMLFFNYDKMNFEQGFVDDYKEIIKEIIDIEKDSQATV